MIIEKEGDLFKYKHQAYAHGVTNKGIMGAGIAVQFRELYPEMFEKYKIFCHEDKPKGGNVFIHQTENQETIYNLITQEKKAYATFEFLKESMKHMYFHARNNDISDIAMPMIGTDLGKLPVDDLMEALNPFIMDSHHHVTLYTFKQPKIRRYHQY